MQDNPLVRIVAATQNKTDTEFKMASFLGQSLGVFPSELRPELSVLLDNGGSDGMGLSEFYNSFLQPQYRNEIVLFVHDDVYLNDWCLVYRLRRAMEHFDVVGVAGNADPDFTEPSWVLAWNTEKYPSGHQRAEALSGAIGHFSQDRTAVAMSYFGPAPRACKLLDGVFIAVKVNRALETGAKFDEQFRFHFYDLDFCRTADGAGLRVGTWPIALTHGSDGAFGSAAWTSARDQYLRKWAV